MARGGPGIIVRPLERLFGRGTVAGLDESELLQRFARNRDEVAFAALVAWHGPMVLGVCRRILGDGHATEDAFQAVFLILVKKAGSIRDGGRLGPWLHGVARRVATRSRVQSARRRRVERPVGEEVVAASSHDNGRDSPAVGDDLERAELRAAIDAEIGRLPEKYRAPVVLCYLEGLTHDQAAQRLGWPVGTVRSRMASARDTLRRRLDRRGLTVPAGLVAASVGTGSTVGKAALLAVAPAISPWLLESTIRAALHVAAAPSWALGVGSGIVSGSVAELTRGVLWTMFTHKLKLAALVVGALGLTAGGGLAVAMQFGGAGFGAGFGQEGRKADEAPQADHASLEQQAERVKRTLASLEKEKSRLDRQIAFLKESLSQLELRIAASEDESAAEAPEAAPAAKVDAAHDTAEDAARPGRAAAVVAGGGFGAVGLGGGFGGEFGTAGPFGRGMGGGFGGMGPADGNASPVIMSARIIAIQPRETGNVAAYSTETGEWSSYTVPEGVKAGPILNGNVMALQMEGNAISEIAVFDADGGRWHPRKLEEPVSGRATPIISSNLVAYGIGHRVYAYSPEADRWDTLTLPEEASDILPNLIQLHAGMIFVEYKGRIHTFIAKRGRWTEFDTRERSSDR